MPKTKRVNPHARSIAITAEKVKVANCWMTYLHLNSTKNYTADELMTPVQTRVTLNRVAWDCV